MSKRGKKRFWTALVAAVLVATLMIFSVVAEEGPFVGSDKLSVETGEDEEVVEEVFVEEDEEILEDEMSEAEEVVETEEELPAGEVTEEAGTDASEPTEGGSNAESEIQAMSVEGEIKPLAADDVLLLDASGNQVDAYETVSDALKAAEEGYTIQLNADVYETVSVEDGAVVTLDLNGHTISANGAASTVVAADGSGTELTIMDSSGSNSGTITGGAPTNGGGVELSGGAVVNFQSGTISGNTASANTRAGAGVHFDNGGGTFNMSGGVISDNTAITANGSGGGVCVNNSGVFNMTGGTITGNQTSSGGNGGGVYVYSGSFNMSGGTISGNTAGGYGGAVNVAAGCTFTMTGGTITDNTASNGGGAVAVRGTQDASRTVFTMSGGTISGNSTSGTGGAIYVDDTTVNIESNAVITENGSSDTTYGGGIYVTSSGILNLTGGEISNNSANLGGGIYNLGSVTMNGGTISGNEATTTNATVDGGGGIYAYGSSASFTMSGGEISGNTASSGYGGGVDISTGANFIMSGGEISGNESSGSNSGGGVQLYGASFTMNGGSISGNKSGNGGAVNITNSGAFTMTGGSITDNEASSQGGGVHVYRGSFTMSGGSITGNTATDHAGGVNVPSSDSVVTISGTAVVTGNTSGSAGEITDNVYLSSNCKLILGSALSGSQMIGVTTATEPTATKDNPPVEYPVQFTTDESGTDYFSTSNQYFFSDKETNTDGDVIGVRASSGGNYLELYVLTPPIFELTYLTDEEGDGPYTTATTSNYLQILAGASDWDLLDDDGKQQVNDDLTAAWQEAGGVGELTYEDLLAQAQVIADATGFEEAYLMADGEGDLYTEATKENYEQILAGESDWDALSDEAKAQINANLTNANNGVELTYPMLLAQAQAVADAAGFEEEYLMADADGNLYTEATKENYEQILAGESDWDALSDEAKAQINADLTAANKGVELTYPMLLEQARAMQEAAGFEEEYLMADADGDLYTEATYSNYAQILSGEDAWEALSDEAKAQINADLTAANGDVELTYPMLLAQAKALADDLGFEEAYLMNDGDGNLYTEATPDNYEQILAGESAWYALTAEEQAQINADLTAANGGEELTYPMLLAQARATGFEETYLTGDDGDLYTEATLENYQQILAGEDAWNALSDEAKAKINDDLTAANGGVPLTYEDLLAQAKAYEVAADFVDEYVRGSDGYTYKEATPANYLQILAGEDEWNAMSQAERDAVNAILAANGSPTYEELLAQAKALAAAEEEDLTDSGPTKTGDGNTLYLYLLLAMAAAAAVAGVAVSRKRPV